MHKNCRSLASAWVLAASLTLLARKAEAQSELATLQGVVTGPNQTPVPGVLVTARDLNAGTVRTARTGSDGFYFIGGIIPSEYALRVVAIGFQPQVDTVRIRVATNPRLDFQLSAATAELAEVEIFACGPTPMLEVTAQLARRFAVHCQVSLEEFMACAVGGCAGCAVEVRTPEGPAMKRVCVDGPVFDAYSVF
jgi:hypothetical protein